VGDEATVSFLWSSEGEVQDEICGDGYVVDPVAFFPMLFLPLILERNKAEIVLTQRVAAALPRGLTAKTAGRNSMMKLEIAISTMRYFLFPSVNAG